MFHHRSLAVCPACACQFFVHEDACPHCGAAVVPAERGGGLQRAAASLALGLAVAAVPLAACGDDTGGSSSGTGGGSTSTEGSGGAPGTGGAAGTGGDTSMMSAYGVAPSSSVSGGGDGGAGGIDNMTISAYGAGGSF